MGGNKQVRIGEEFERLLSDVKERFDEIGMTLSTAETSDIIAKRIRGNNSPNVAEVLDSIFSDL